MCWDCRHKLSILHLCVSFSCTTEECDFPRTNVDTGWYHWVWENPFFLIVFCLRTRIQPSSVWLSETRDWKLQEEVPNWLWWNFVVVVFKKDIKKWLHYPLDIACKCLDTIKHSHVKNIITGKPEWNMAGGWGERKLDCNDYTDLQTVSFGLRTLHNSFLVLLREVFVLYHVDMGL